MVLIRGLESSSARFLQKVKRYAVLGRATVSAGAGIASAGIHHAARFSEVPYYASEVALGAGFGLATVFPALLVIRALRQRAAIEIEGVPPAIAALDSGLSQRLSQLRGEIERLTTEETILTAELDGLRRKLLDKDLRITQADSEVERLTRERADLGAEVRALWSASEEGGHKLERAKAEIKEQKAQVDILSGNLERTEEALTAAKEEIDDWKILLDKIRDADDPNEPIVIRKLGEGGMGIAAVCYDPQRQKFMVVKELFNFALVSQERLRSVLGTNFESLISGVMKEKEGSPGKYEFLSSIKSEADIQVSETKSRRALVAIWNAAREITREAKKRFENEQRALDRVKGGNIVEGYGRIGNRIAMELIRGKGLDIELMREGKIPLVRALAVTRQVASGLKSFAAASMVHRDLKPENIRLVAGKGPQDEGWIKLIDLGSAKLPSVAAHQTILGSIAPGTLEYMAPERFEAERSDEERRDIRSDTWALGVILYQMLSSKVPFPFGGIVDATAQERQHTKVSREPLPDICSEIPGTPRAVQALLEKMMAKDPAERPGPAEIIAEVDVILGQLAI